MENFILDSSGKYQTRHPVTQDDIVDQAQCILRSRLKRPGQHAFTDPSSVKTFLRLCLTAQEREVFACLFLDNRHRLLHYEELFRGTIDGASVHPREVVKAALEHNAAAVILAHNHPSGITTASKADINITQRLKKALDLVEIRVLDHMIIGHDEPLSFAEQGLM